MIYLDYQATTPLAPEARDAMVPWLGGPDTTGFGNPHSAHRLGRLAAAAVELAREQVAALLPAGGRVVFTSGATEAINLAIKGLAPKVIAASAIEHAAVLDCAAALRARSEVHILSVGSDGVFDPATLLPEGIGLLAVMQVNNEIGTVQPVALMADRVHQRGGLMLCDAVQSFGRLAIPEGPDLIAISAHKIHGPKGIGALWVRDGITLEPLIHGGGQEQGLRSGTLSPALCAGFGAAAHLADEQMSQDSTHVATLGQRARALFAEWTLNGSAGKRYPGNLNIRRDGVDVARLMSDVRAVMFSAGSACASGSGRPSHVLRAIGLSDVQAKSSLRLGFGRYTTIAELEQAADWLNDAATQQG
ncbi:MAG: cysteine desulfurase family protein [Croceibacterium sp.]